MTANAVTAELLVDARNGTGESPVWLAAEQALYWVDIPTGTLHRLVPATGAVSVWRTPEMLACIAPHAQGGFIAGMETGLFHVLPQANGSTQCTRLVRIAHSAENMRLNDGRCDRQGRFLAGSMVIDTALGQHAGCLYSYTNNNNAKILVDDLIVSNGLGFSPDGRTMYLSDSHVNVQTIWAFDYDTDTGTPSNRRVFVDMHTYPGRPDGGAVDADGCYWICGNDAGLIHRFTPAGNLDRSLAVPVKKPAMCAFGGPNLDTLFVTSIRPDNMDLSDQPLAGGVFALRPGVCGLPEPSFKPHLHL